MIRKILSALWLLLLLPSLLFAEGALPVVATPATALADYVGKQDDSYKWFKRSEGAYGSTKYVELPHVADLEGQSGSTSFHPQPEQCNVSSMRCSHHWRWLERRIGSAGRK
jgi:hypothetical protein